MKETFAGWCGGFEEISGLEGDVRLRGYLPNNDQGGETLRHVREWFDHELSSLDFEKYDPSEYFQVDRVIEEDWAENWKRYYKPVRIGRRFMLSPSWEQPGEIPEDDLLIRLDPGQAFGTGHHETTQLCIELMENLDMKGWRVADVGCGSGILAIAAAKLQAEEIWASDVDTKVLDITRKNSEMNKVNDQIFTREGSAEALQKEAPFKLVVANINSETLIDLRQELITLMSEKGMMIWSGIIEGSHTDVESCLKSTSLRIATRKRSGEWFAYLLEK